MKTQKPMRGVFERPPGSGCWWINYRDADGGRHREKIGRYSVAEQAYLHRRQEIREGKFTAPRAPRGPSIAELIELALADKKTRLASSSYTCDRARAGVLSDAFGGVAASRLTPQMIEAKFRGLRDSGLTGAAVNRYRSLLSSIFSFAIRADLARSNPAARVPRYKESDHRIRFLDQFDDKEEQRLRRVIRKRCPEHEPELDLALHTGIRRGEQFGLKWEDVDLERGILTVRGKTGRRFVEINGCAREAIKKLHASRQDGLSFVCRDAKREGQRDWRRWFEDAIAEAKIRNFRWHDLRHTFASRLVMAGVDLPTVQQLLGHRSILMTMRYAHLSQSHRSQAVKKLDGHQQGTLSFAAAG